MIYNYIFWCSLLILGAMPLLVLDFKKSKTKNIKDKIRYDYWYIINFLGLILIGIKIFIIAFKSFPPFFLGIVSILLTMIIIPLIIGIIYHSYYIIYQKNEIKMKMKID